MKMGDLAALDSYGFSDLGIPLGAQPREDPREAYSTAPWAAQALTHPDAYEPLTSKVFPDYRAPDETTFRMRFAGGAPTELPTVGDAAIPSGPTWEGTERGNRYAANAQKVGEFVVNTAIPHSMTDVGLMLTPGGLGAKAVGGAIGSVFDADPAQAGKGDIIRRGARLGSIIGDAERGVVKSLPTLGETSPLSPAALKRSYEEVPVMGGLADQGAYSYKMPHETRLEVAPAAPIAEAPLDVPRQLGGASGGAEGLRAAHLQAERRAGTVRPLEGLPRPEQVLSSGEVFVPGPYGRAHEVAQQYMADKNFGIAHPTKFHPVDKDHAKAIAQAYEDMPDFDPAALPSYKALARETLDQFRAIKKSGLKLTPVDAETYPYRNPREVAKDIADNNHMAYFRTDAGFGAGEIPDPRHPMLKKSGVKIGDHELLYNDLFRIVHDYMGHVKNGYGFRAAGEDNAWRAHAAMYSPEARPAMTSETRGQNSWLNHGPYGEANRTASTEDTVFAKQKVALLPHWVMRDLEGTMPEFARPNVIEKYVTNPQRSAYPGIYDRPDVIAQKAAANVVPEHPALKELFNVTRDDLYQIGQQGTRQGNMEPNVWMPSKATSGSYSADAIMNPANAQRQIDALSEAMKHPDLAKGMLSWYVMDPAFQQMERLVGREQAIKDYTRLNATMSPFSAGSNVNTEINRGTAANMMAARGEYDRFHQYAGTAEDKRGRNFPNELRDVLGHAYHGVQSDPVQRWLATGEHGYGKDAQKIFLYHGASGVPETGFQTTWPVLDAHLARSSGAADVRTLQDYAENMKGPEYRSFAPYYRKNIAEPLGLQPVSAQGLQWGTFAHATGVDTPIGATKLELLAQRIWERAQKLGIDPKKLRDDVLTGKAHASWLLGAPAGAAVMGGLAAQDNYQQ